LSVSSACVGNSDDEPLNCQSYLELRKNYSFTGQPQTAATEDLISKMEQSRWSRCAGGCNVVRMQCCESLNPTAWNGRFPSRPEPLRLQLPVRRCGPGLNTNVHLARHDAKRPLPARAKGTLCSPQAHPTSIRNRSVVERHQVPISCVALHRGYTCQNQISPLAAEYAC
jgi:hypothetical protein